SDAALGTGEAEYRSLFLAFVAFLRGLNIKAPVYVSVTTKCLLAGPYVEDNPVARAQVALAGAEDSLRAGMNTDQLLGELDRFDGCDLSGSGVAKVASGWARLLGAPLGQRLGRPRPARCRRFNRHPARRCTVLRRG